MIVHEMSYSPSNTYTPFGLEGDTTLYVGKGENTVSVDLAASQSDSEIVIDITQDYSGTLDVDGEGAFLAARIKIPPARYSEPIDTGRKDSQDKEIYEVKKLPIDVGNVTVELFPLYFPIEDKEETK